MSAFIGFLSFVLFIAFIIGMIKPTLILRWLEKPTRLKVFGFWILGSFALGILAVLTESEEDRAKADIELAQTYIDTNDYVNAISTLETIEENNPLYHEARNLLQKADNLNKASLNEQKAAQDAKARMVAATEKDKLKSSLERELASVSDGVDFSIYRGSIDELQMELVLFATYSTIILQGENTDDPKIKRLAKQLKDKVSKMQASEFPIMRKEYAKIVAQKMWENDIKVHSDGAKSKNINFTGGVFAANKNKKDFHEQVYEILSMLRFNQARYRWYEGDDEYTYWTIYEGSDSDLVTFE